MATHAGLILLVARPGFHHTEDMLREERAASVAALALRQRERERDCGSGGYPSPYLNKSINKAFSKVPCQPSLCPTEEVTSRCKEQKKKNGDAFK